MKRLLIDDPVVSSFFFNFFTEGSASYPVNLYPQLKNILFDPYSVYFSSLYFSAGKVTAEPVVMRTVNKESLLFLFYKIKNQGRVFFLGKLS